MDIFFVNKWPPAYVGIKSGMKSGRYVVVGERKKYCYRTFWRYSAAPNYSASINDPSRTETQSIYEQRVWSYTDVPLSLSYWVSLFPFLIYHEIQSARCTRRVSRSSTFSSTVVSAIGLHRRFVRGYVCSEICS